mgnify:CR=1 FL=1
MAIQRRKKIKSVVVDNRNVPDVKVRVVKPIRISKIDNTTKKNKYY